jgi:chromosome segregation ATPase
VEELNRSIQEAKETYEEVNRQLDELEAMRQKAIRTKEEAERVYNENKGLIDTIVHYVEQGISLFSR